MSIDKITDADLEGKGVVGQPDVPGLSAAEMQAKIEEIVRSVAIPKINAIIDEITENYVTTGKLDEVVFASGSVASVFGRAGTIVAQTGDYTPDQVGAAAAEHASRHKTGGKDPISPEDIGAMPASKSTQNDVTTYTVDGNIEVSGKFKASGNVDFAQSYVAVKTPANGVDAVNLAYLQANYIGNAKEIEKNGAVTVTAENNAEYKFTAVTSLSLTVAATTDCHGFITFASGTPIVTVSGYAATGGDDPTKAVGGEMWEFDCMGGYLLWKNWGSK